MKSSKEWKIALSGVILGRGRHILVKPARHRNWGWAKPPVLRIQVTSNRGSPIRHLNMEMSPLRWGDLNKIGSVNHFLYLLHLYGEGSIINRNRSTEGIDGDSKHPEGHPQPRGFFPPDEHEHILEVGSYKSDQGIRSLNAFRKLHEQMFPIGSNPCFDTITHNGKGQR